jgi:hypothetical protein
MGIAMRRHHEQRIKARARKCLVIWEQDVNPSSVGKWVSTHGCSCKCLFCRNPRRHFGDRTRQEKIMELNFKDMINNEGG